MDFLGKHFSKSNLIICFDIILFIILWHTLPSAPDVTLGLSILIFIAILWLTEAVHITITALIIPVLAVSFHVFSTTDALKHFSNPVIYQFLGGFALAAAMQKQALDKYIAEKILYLTRGHMATAVLLLMAITALLSMWISNTATTAMMLPLVLGVLRKVDENKERHTYTFVLLGIAYSASIGGMATLVGTAPNAIAASEAKLNFLGWLHYGLPASLLLLPMVILLLFIIQRPNLKHRFEFTEATIHWDSKKLLTLVIFGIIVLLWIFSRPINALLGGIDKFDALVGLLAIILLCVCKVVTWKDIQEHTDWGILVLLGSGLCLSSVLKETNTSYFLAQQLSQLLDHNDTYLSLLIIGLFTVFLTEFASNTATAALLIPVFATIGTSLGMSPIILSALVGISTSCAFMLPAATPPNAMVFSAGYIRQKEMLRVGWVLNIASAIILSLIATYIW